MVKVMRRLARTFRQNEAIKTFHNVAKLCVRKDTLSMNVLMDTLCMEMTVKDACDAFLEPRNEIHLNPSSFNIGWCKAQKSKEAQRTMETMNEFCFYPLCDHIY